MFSLRSTLLTITIGLTTMLGSTVTAQSAQFDEGHGVWTEILQRRVNGSIVDYAGLKASDEAALDRYLSSLGHVTRATYTTWPSEIRLAFWINVYNAFTVKLILNHYPLKSIRSIGFLPGAAFRKSFIELPGLRADPYSLKETEHEILRQEFRDPRIHFAIVCASKSCPQLRSEAYRGAEIGQQLDEAARKFLSDTTKNRFDKSTQTLWLSAIFDWFDEDFEKSAGSITAYVARYAPGQVARAIRAGEVRVKFLDYDWSLNGK